MRRISSVRWRPDVSRLTVPGVKREVVLVLLGVALLLMMAKSLQFEFRWRPGMLNPDCLIHVRDLGYLMTAGVLAAVAWLVPRQKVRTGPPLPQLDGLDQRFFSPELREYYRSHPARLRFLKRAIRRNNIQRVRALVALGTPLRASAEYLSALELAELYGNEAIIDVLRYARTTHA